MLAAAGRQVLPGLARAFSTAWATWERVWRPPRPRGGPLPPFEAQWPEGGEARMEAALQRFGGALPADVQQALVHAARAGLVPDDPATSPSNAEAGDGLAHRVEHLLALAQSGAFPGLDPVQALRSDPALLSVQPRALQRLLRAYDAEAPGELTAGRAASQGLVSRQLARLSHAGHAGRMLTALHTQLYPRHLAQATAAGPDAPAAAAATAAGPSRGAGRPVGLFRGGSSTSAAGSSGSGGPVASVAASAAAAAGVAFPFAVLGPRNANFLLMRLDEVEASLAAVVRLLGGVPGLAQAVACGDPGVLAAAPAVLQRSRDELQREFESHDTGYAAALLRAQPVALRLGAGAVRARMGALADALGLHSSAAGGGGGGRGRGRRSWTVPAAGAGPGAPVDVHVLVLQQPQLLMRPPGAVRQSAAALASLLQLSEEQCATVLREAPGLLLRSPLELEAGMGRLRQRLEADRAAGGASAGVWGLGAEAGQSAREAAARDPALLLAAAAPAAPGSAQ